MSKKTSHATVPLRQRYQCSHRAYQPAAPDPGCMHPFTPLTPFPFNDFDPSFHHACQHWHLTHGGYFPDPPLPTSTTHLHLTHNSTFSCSLPLFYLLVLHFLSLPIFLLWYLLNFLCPNFFPFTSSPFLSPPPTLLCLLSYLLSFLFASVSFPPVPPD